MKRIKEIELASLLAHEAMVNELVGLVDVKGVVKYPTEEDVWVFDEENDIDVYPEEVQNVFNGLYDYYLTVIDDCSEKED